MKRLLAHSQRFLTLRASLSAGYRQPGEWMPHRACWLAWPDEDCSWQNRLPQVRTEFVSLCRSIVDKKPVTGERRGEQLQILVRDSKCRAEAGAALEGLDVQFHLIPYGDIWVRDTGPIFVKNPADGTVAPICFAFNGWGGHFLRPHDDQVAKRISEATAETLGRPGIPASLILEGGSIEVDGEGTGLTTEQCLLNPDRNPDLTRTEIEQVLKDTLGIKRLLWLKRGLLNDPTSGHIDTLARFVAPGKVVCMKATDPSSDPNHEVYEEIARDLAAFTDARGARIEVIRIPSPGKVMSTDEQDEVLPASYVNFYIGNSTVVVPAFGSPMDQVAVDAIARLFPNRRTVGSPAISLLHGGGSFHCITQQEPKTGVGL